MNRNIVKNGFFFSWRWHCKRAGGLFLGLRLSFPGIVIYQDKSSRNTWTFSVGLIVATIDLEYRSKPIETGINLGEEELEVTESKSVIDVYRNYENRLAKYGVAVENAGSGSMG
jgi:hypothetical protein